MPNLILLKNKGKLTLSFVPPRFDDKFECVLVEFMTKSIRFLYFTFLNFFYNRNFTPIIIKFFQILKLNIKLGIMGNMNML